MGIDIYHKWLFSKERPTPIIQDTQTFIRVIYIELVFIIFFIGNI